MTLIGNPPKCAKEGFHSLPRLFALPHPVRQRAPERSSRCATPATGPGARGFLYRKPGVGTGTDSRARSTGPEAAGAVTVAGLQGQGAVRTLSRGRSPPGFTLVGFHTALDARTALC